MFWSQWEAMMCFRSGFFLLNSANLVNPSLEGRIKWQYLISIEKTSQNTVMFWSSRASSNPVSSSPSSSSSSSLLFSSVSLCSYRRRWRKERYQQGGSDSDSRRSLLLLEELDLASQVCPDLSPLLLGSRPRVVSHCQWIPPSTTRIFLDHSAGWWW